jgi:hypothetical protein
MNAVMRDLAWAYYYYRKEVKVFVDRVSRARWPVPVMDNSERLEVWRRKRAKLTVDETLQEVVRKQPCVAPSDNAIKKRVKSHL